MYPPRVHSENLLDTVPLATRFIMEARSYLEWLASLLFNTKMACLIDGLIVFDFEGFGAHAIELRQIGKQEDDNTGGVT